MDIESIKKIVNDPLLPESIKRGLIISVISTDEEAIPDILKIIGAERERGKSIIRDSNSELSRALVVLEDISLKKDRGNIVDPKWIVGEIKKHYLKWEDYIKCNFNVEGLPW